MVTCKHFLNDLSGHFQYVACELSVTLLKSPVYVWFPFMRTVCILEINKHYVGVITETAVSGESEQFMGRAAASQPH